MQIKLLKKKNVITNNIIINADRSESHDAVFKKRQLFHNCEYLYYYYNFLYIIL